MEVSRIIYGGIVSMNDGQDNSDKYVKFAIDNGVNYFDIAPTYGDAQEKLGNSLAPYRKDVFLACKTMERSGEKAKQELENSFKLLQTDYFDVYQMHSLFNVKDVENAFKNDGAFKVMLKAKEDGLVKHLGVTCHSEDAALRALELYDFDTVLFPTNWGLNICKGFGTRISAKCKEKNVGFLGMKSMIQRAWLNEEEKKASRFPKSWCMPITDNKVFTISAMKYAYQKIGADVLVPPGNIENFTFAIENIDEILSPLTQSELDFLMQESKKLEGHYFFDV